MHGGGHGRFKQQHGEQQPHGERQSQQQDIVMGDSRPTVTAALEFNPERDAETLRTAMKGLGTNEDKIVSVVCKRSYDQLQQIKQTYQQCYGRILLEDLKKETSGHFQQIIVNQFHTPAEYDAVVLHNAIKGVGTNEKPIIEIMCTRTNQELDDAKEAYSRMFKKDLTADLIGDTSGHFKKFLVSLTSGGRDTGPANRELAETDARKLYDTGEAKLGTEEETWNLIFARRSWPQLKLTFQIYKEKYNKKEGILGAIKSEFSGDIHDCYKAVATTVLETREAYFAENLYYSMKGLGTDDDKLIRTMVSRCRIDLLTVKQRFLEKFKKTLEHFIEHDTSGDQKKALLALAHGNQ